jgi:hypothetical protein
MQKMMLATSKDQYKNPNFSQSTLIEYISSLTTQQTVVFATSNPFSLEILSNK